MKSKSDRAFFDFLLTNKKSGAWIVLILGGALIFLSFFFSGSEPHSEEPVGIEAELVELCSSVEGVGRCEVMITYTDSGEVYAVAVLSEGADSVSVRAALTELISSLFGIGANRITILKIGKSIE